MYTRYFGLAENPFALSPDPRYLYLSRRHREALAHLTFGINQGGGFVQLTGEVGTGKTLMIRALLERLPPTVDVALILYPFLSVREFIAAICSELRIAVPDTEGLKPVIDALNTYLLDNHARGRRTVLIIDEAHKLSHEVLEQVRLLTNLETTKEKLLQILLIGQPELNDLLGQHGLRQLAQRITARYALAPLSRTETIEYIVHRLAVAGLRSPLFTRAAAHRIHRLSRGIPRLVNVICDRALLGAYASGKGGVNLFIAQRAASEVGHATPRRFALAAIIVSTVAVLGVGVWQLAPRYWPTASVNSLVALETPTPIAPAPIAVPVSVPEATPVLAATPMAVAAAPPPTAQPAKADLLAGVLADRAARTDMSSAFSRLFAQWTLNYAEFSGNTGCERAHHAGLRCLLVAGTWNTLREYNRPAVIELRDARGTLHHAVVTGLAGNHARLDFGGRARTLPLAAIDPYWFGKALLLWQPPPIDQTVLRRGMRGPAIIWLRQALARAGRLAPDQALASDVFDAALERHVKTFQQAQRLVPDGVVGEATFVRLDIDGPKLLNVRAFGHSEG
jgi:general secretion pathway protein A